MKIERNHLIILFLILLGLVLFRTFSGNIFHAVYSPSLVTITPTLSDNIYVASVTWIKFEPRWPSGDLYPYSFKIEGIKTEYLKDNYCYLNVSRIINHGEAGAYCAWEIKAKSGGDIIIRAPLKNNICNFYDNGELVNLDDLIYNLVCTYPNDGTKSYTYDCKSIGCWDKIKVQSNTISGKLYLLLKEGSLGSCPPTGGYCTSDKTFEVRNYYCEQGYGTIDKCFVGHCKYNVLYSGECGFLENCVNGKCIITQETKTKIMLGAIVGIAFIVLLIIWARRK